MDYIPEFLAQKKFAVVGSFRDETKVAYSIVQSLLKRGYKVFPVNPTAKEVVGLTVCPSVKELPEAVDVVDLVTPPEATEKIVKDCQKLGIIRIWMQPGAESFPAIEFCKTHGIKVVAYNCIMKYL